ncbi:MAG: hypothetical protein LBE38_01995 [Deltaproteobacteria bacterium]|jgi:trigger factor|nr:hypothetical protein [Deltaproteobacteria bacterium]
MRIAIEDHVEDSTQSVILDMDWEDYGAELLGILAKYQRAKIPGFSPGFIPDHVIIRKRESEVKEDVLASIVIPTIQADLVKKNITTLTPLLTKTLTFSLESPLHYTGSYVVLPQFELPDFSKIELVQLSSLVDEMEVDRELEIYQEDSATLQQAPEDHVIAVGDNIIVSYTMWLGEKKIDLKKTELEDKSIILNQEITEENSLFGFIAKNAIGQKKGSILEIPCKMDAKHKNRAIAGKTVTYKVLIKQVNLVMKHELNDELAQNTQIAGINTLEDLKTFIRDTLNKRYVKEFKQVYEYDLKRAILNLTEINIPDRLKDLELKKVLAESDLPRLTLERIKKGIPTASDTKLLSSYYDQIEENLKWTFIYDKICKQQNFSVSEEDIEDYIALLSKSTGTKVDVLKKQISLDKGYINLIRSDVKYDKFIKYLNSQVVIKELNREETIEEIKRREQHSIQERRKQLLGMIAENYASQHTHTHEHPHDHDHPHEHSHNHPHFHEHEHEHEDGVKHTHEHRHIHGHKHEHGHTHEHDGQEAEHGHTPEGHEHEHTHEAHEHEHTHEGHEHEHTHEGHEHGHTHEGHEHGHTHEGHEHEHTHYHDHEHKPEDTLDIPHRHAHPGDVKPTTEPETSKDNDEPKEGGQ